MWQLCGVVVALVYLNVFYCIALVMMISTGMIGQTTTTVTVLAGWIFTAVAICVAKKFDMGEDKDSSG